MPALAGANLIYGLGMIEMGMTIDYGQLVMDNEFARMIKYVVQGIPVTDDTLAVDVMHEIGPFQDFLSHDHTFGYMRKQSRPELIDRTTREDWTAAGCTDIHQRALAKARDILANHHPPPLSESVQRELKAIIADAEDVMGVPPGDRMKAAG